LFTFQSQWSWEFIHMWGYQGWEDIEWWTCARAKENYDYEAPMASSLLDYTWLEKEWKFRLWTTWHPSLHFIFLLLDSSLSYLSCHTSSLFLFFFSFFQTLSFIISYTYFSLLFYFSFFLFHTHTFLFTFPSFNIFISLLKALNSSLSLHNVTTRPGKYRTIA
jgi:hypothetical protein